MVYLGVPMVLLDRFLLIKATSQQATPDNPELLFTPAEHHRA
jgi:hypothetical protein